MPPQDWPRIVSASVVPVVIISACGLLCLAFYNRLSSLVSRLRAFHRERLAEQERLDRHGADHEAFPAAHGLMLEVLGEQTDHLLRRARLLRSALMCLLCTIACLTACSLLSGLAVLWPAAAGAAVGLFVAGMLLLLAAVVLAMCELRRALDPVELETQLVSGLTEGLGSRAPGNAGAAARIAEGVGAAADNGSGA
jgi:hypothetical protein